MKLNWLLLLIPAAIVLDWLKANPIVVFAASALAIVPLAGLMFMIARTIVCGMIPRSRL